MKQISAISEIQKTILTQHRNAKSSYRVLDVFLFLLLSFLITTSLYAQTLDSDRDRCTDAQVSGLLGTLYISANICTIIAPLNCAKLLMPNYATLDTENGTSSTLASGSLINTIEMSERLGNFATGVDSLILGFVATPLDVEVYYVNIIDGVTCISVDTALSANSTTLSPYKFVLAG